MNRLLGVLGLIGLAMQPALAADMAVKARPAAPAAVHNWSGCYLGGYVGSAWGGDVAVRETLNPAIGAFYNGLPYSYDLDSSVTAGGTLGCNYQTGSVVFGLEGELGYMRLTGSAIDPTTLPVGDTVGTTRIGDWYGLAAGRLGFAADRALFYVKGGVAFVRTESSVVDACAAAPCFPGLVNATGSSNRATWALGGGIEYALTSSWSLKGEYLYLAIDRSTAVCGPGGGGAIPGTYCWQHEVDGIHTAKIGLNYRFH